MNGRDGVGAVLLGPLKGLLKRADTSDVARLAILLSCALALFTAGSASASPGDLDAGFGTDGVVTTPFGPSIANGSAVVVQPDGKIVVAGWGVAGAANAFALARYEADGTLDASFDGDGKVTTSFGAGGDDQAWTVALQPDGKIVAGGFTSNGADYDFAVVRYQANGSLDTTFSNDGIAVTPVGTGEDYLWGLALQSDGKVIAVGSSSNGTDEDVALVRYASDGTVDLTATTAVGAADDGAYAVKVQSDGKIVIAGYSSNGSDKDFAVLRYEGDGTLDASFDGDGKATTAVGSAADEANALAVQTDGKIVAAGTSSNGADTDFAVTRYEVDGELDTAFSGDGKVTTDLADGFAFAVALQPDGRILTGGYTDSVAFPGNARFALARYGTDGSLDTTFGTSGTVVTTVGQSAPNYAYGVALQPDGKFLLAGVGVDGRSVFGVARYIGDGTPPANPSLSSTSHSIGAWSTDPTVDAAFTGALDDWSGVDGFSLAWDTSEATFPDDVKDVEETETGATSPALTDGSHYLHLHAADNIGNWSDPAHLGPFRIDTAAPTGARMTGSTLSRRFQKRRSFAVHWTASDATSGVASYGVRYRRARYDGGFGSAVLWKNGATTTRGRFKARPGSTYCLSVRASDVAGNMSAYGPERCTAIPVNDGGLTREGPWLRRFGSGHYLGSYLASWTPGASLSLPVAAKRLKLVATRCPACGVVDVYLGSTRLGRIDLHAAETRKKRLIAVASFDRVRRGTLSLRVVSQGKPVFIEGVGVSRV